LKESSEVLARKYRPKDFDELVGQDTIAQTLSLALDSNRLSHAYLFSGLRGSGKTSTARIFAKALLCEKGVSSKPCGVCSSCVSASQNSNIDIIEMDGASSRKIDDIRDLVEQTKYKPASARYKIFIIDEVHMLTKEAFNALLKTLEEPPSYIKFILATTDPLKLPATILSRTQHFRFKSISTTKIVEHLAYILNLEKIEYEDGALEILARSGSGSLRDTLTLLDQAIIYSKNHIDINVVTDMLGLVDPKFLSQLFEAIFAKDYQKVVGFTKELEAYEADMVVDELISYLKEKMFRGDREFSTLILDRFFRILSESKYLFSINADGGFVLSLIFFKMIEAMKIKEIDQMIESLQKGVEHLSVDVAPKAITIKEPAIQKERPKEQIIPKIAEQKVDDGLVKFKTLTDRIQDRNAKLGECFRESVSFVSYKDDVLIWESCADDECKQNLKHGYSAIKQLVREVFGFATKIKGLPCTKVAPQPPTPEPIVTNVEMGIDSCMANSMGFVEEEPRNHELIKDEPMVKKAQELFNVTKATIQPKV